MSTERPNDPQLNALARVVGTYGQTVPIERAAVVIDERLAALAARAAAAIVARKQPSQGRSAPPTNDEREGVLVRAPRSPFVGPECPHCGAQKLRLHPSGGAAVWCFGCGLRSFWAAIDREDIAKFSEETLCRLDPRRQRKTATPAGEK